MGVRSTVRASSPQFRISINSPWLFQYVVRIRIQLLLFCVAMPKATQCRGNTSTSSIGLLLRTAEQIPSTMTIRISSPYMYGNKYQCAASSCVTGRGLFANLGQPSGTTPSASLSETTMAMDGWMKDDDPVSHFLSHRGPHDTRIGHAGTRVRLLLA